MPRVILENATSIERLTNYQVPEDVKRDFPQELPYTVVLHMQGRRLQCRCGEPEWALFRDNEEFVCTCSACGRVSTFGMFCFAFLDVNKLDDPDVWDIADAAVLDRLGRASHEDIEP